MNPKLSDAMLEILRVIDDGGRLAGPDGSPAADRGRLSALWKRGLIEDATEAGRWVGYRLTAEGRLALQHGRQMLSGRSP